MLLTLSIQEVAHRDTVPILIIMDESTLKELLNVGIWTNAHILLTELTTMFLNVCILLRQALARGLTGSIEVAEGILRFEKSPYQLFGQWDLLKLEFVDTRRSRPEQHSCCE